MTRRLDPDDPTRWAPTIRPEDEALADLTPERLEELGEAACKGLAKAFVQFFAVVLASIALATGSVLVLAFLLDAVVQAVT